METACLSLRYRLDEVTSLANAALNLATQRIAHFNKRDERFMRSERLSIVGRYYDSGGKRVAARRVRTVPSV